MTFQKLSGGMAATEPVALCWFQDDGESFAMCEML
jgi:hypothetical protein